MRCYSLFPLNPGRRIGLLPSTIVLRFGIPIKPPLLNRRSIRSQALAMPAASLLRLAMPGRDAPTLAKPAVRPWQLTLAPDELCRECVKP
jgi:hypothetical protein